MGLIRFLLAITIVIHHSYPLFGLLFLGRDAALKAFYIISGFYMSLILNEKYIGKNGGYKLFITNRFFRIYPTYWLILLLTYIFEIILLHQNILSQPPLNILSDVTLLIRNDYLQINTDNRQLLTLPVAYTLVSELCFYIVAPFIVKLSRKMLFILTGIALFIHFLVQVILRLNHNPAGDWFFPEIIIFFLLGVLSYEIYKVIKHKTFPKKYLVSTFILILALVISYSNIPFNYTFTSIIKFKEWIFLLIFLVSIPFIFKLTNKLSIDRIIGETSYPIYLCHLLLINFFIQIGVIKSQNSITTIFFICVSVMFAFIIYLVFEKPIEKFRQKRLK